ncbi:MAG: peptidase M50, partial [Brevundimonas sp.]
MVGIGCCAHLDAMSNIDTPNRTPDRIPGPWDPKPEDPAVRAAPAAPAEIPVEKDQSLVWALLSTALMGGFLWWITQSAIVAGAVLIGLFVHEAGHALAMNKMGMGP